MFTGLNKLTFLLGSVAIFASSLVSAQSMIKNCAKAGHVALTYDDGPNIYTESLVNYLDSVGVKATFFINGDNFLQLNDSVEAQQALKAAHSSQHQIASHTWSHIDLNTLSGNAFDSEIVKLEQITQSLIGVKPAYIRPPYGNANSETIRKLNSKGYEVIEWSTDTKDFESHDISQEMDNVRKSFSRSDLDNGFIILSHDVYEQTTDELTKELVAYVKEQGFKFCTVAECVGKPAYK